MRPHGVLACAVALLALSAAADAKPTSETKQVAPNGMMERDLELVAGTRVAWSISIAPDSERAVFNIHTHHANGTAEDLEFGLVNGTAEGVFQAPRDGIYSWMASNALSRRTLAINITLDLGGDEAPEGSNPLPGWEAPLLLAGAGLALLLVRRPPRGRAVHA